VHFAHSSALWAQFPQLVPGVLVAGGIHPDAPVRLEAWYERARQRLSHGPESELAEVGAWRRAFAQMGLKPTQYRSAGEALLRRFREVIFADAAGHAHARRWTFRQSRRSTVSAETRRVLIVAEGLHAGAGADVAALVDELAGSIAALWEAPTARAVLTAAAPRIEFPS
jgi:DNA/RNA-binding domain of Phe-tRNA-synthetase-like protein